MRTRKNLFIFYIYLKQKLKIIKEQVQNRSTASGKEFHSRLYLVLEKAGIAAITTLLIYATMMVMSLGRIIWPSGHMWLEIVSAFFFLLVLFWTHSKISNFVSSSRTRGLQPWKKASAEVVIVILLTLVLHWVFNVLPLRLVYPTTKFDPVSLRTSLVMVIIISLFFYFLVERERSKRKLQEKILRSTQLQKENYQAQIQSLKNQVNPHFLFNSLSVLGFLIRKNEKQAREFVYRLSKVYRSFLDHGHEQLVSLKKEMELTESYIYLLSTRFGDNVQFKIDVSQSQLSLLLPPGSLQMLVENAIKHNGSTRKKPLLITIFSVGNELVVKNNLQPRLEKIDSTGTGLENITRRYKFLTDREVNFSKTEEEFVAKLPLLKVETYENSNY